MTILANGQVATTQSDIFKVSGADVFPTTKVIINKITLFNTNAITQTAILSVKKFGGNTRKLRQFVLLENEGGEYLEPGETFELNNGDSLQAETTTVSAIDFTIMGVRA